MHNFLSISSQLLQIAYTEFTHWLLTNVNRHRRQQTHGHLSLTSNVSDSRRMTGFGAHLT